MKYAIALVVLLCAGTAQAQMQNYTTFPLGNSFVTHGPNGYSATTFPLGNSMVTQVNPGFAPPPPIYTPPMQSLQPLTTLNPWGYR